MSVSSAWWRDGRRSGPWVALSLLAVLVIPAPGSAQDAEENDQDESGDEAADTPEVDAEEPPPDREPTAAELAAPHADAGRVAMMRGELEEALGHLRQAHEIDPSSSRLREVAVVLEALRRDEELLEVYDELMDRGAETARRAEVRARREVLIEAQERVEAEAQAEAVDGGEGEEEEEAEEEDNPFSIFEDPVFWIVAAVVAGAVVVSVVLESTNSVNPAIPGDDGVLIQTLVEW